MSGAARRRGQPLALLGVVLGGWIALRVVLWEPMAAAYDDRSSLAVTGPSTALATASQPDPVHADKPVAAVTLPSTSVPAMQPVAPSWTGASVAKSLFAPSAIPGKPHAGSPRPPAPVLFTPREPMIEPRIAAGHQLMMLAALGQLPLPPLLAAQQARPVLLSTPAPLPRREGDRVSRWSGDGWVLLRRGSDGLSTAPSFARYGASQAGAVLRYSIAPASALRPQAFVRLTRALVDRGESEAAAGLSLRPLRGVPLRLYGEGRVQRVAGATKVRPAASLVTELPPLALPLGAEAEVYAQGGYVGGRGATPFFDAQLTADRKLAARGPAELRLGAGAWAGGQEGATRLDLGPRASVRLRIGEVASRLALDWRFRVAGNAAPASGPALTLSAGF